MINLKNHWKRFVISTLIAGIAALALFVLAGNSGSTAAATWHNGTPTILRGKWRTKVSREYGVSGRAHLHITKKGLMNSPKFPPQDPDYTSKLHYRYVGKHVYSIIGREFNNAPANGIKVHFLVKVYNHHKIYFKQVNGSSDGNGVFYKY
ncbi:hypothetical protein ABC628_06230 [Lentilactobacillus otakiensis]|uniref:Uncharacterized protein n=1 Tax=Lentilactobacillus otakiensis DSM 19908 = JCM 15040 TaxID=1423780 RepID=S4NHE3_9LACO|nr:hypothetical protein [Lentilactobacillus otakiensis]KRL09814.1 hypothetical protein FD05_GL000796 [Lentilactobacillus otakiensis DSM 19908 = JCM 15040]MBZ3776160.1 hypothetical protein [Lentilactobacillus otakiensis]MDV3517165.1 hypothetical protein [Lentilactobacillus otakiensis]GAD16597.1 hypothetical protein LOT_1135 [Lentilactobacillus otakiensis DSM 19908 = JCM 15040]